MASLTVTGVSGATYTLDFGTNAECRIEEATTRSYDELLANLRSATPRRTWVREFMRGGLIDPVGLTLDEVGAVIDDIGGCEAILAGLGSQSPAAIEAREVIAKAQAVVAELEQTLGTDPTVLEQAKAIVARDEQPAEQTSKELVTT